MRSLAGCWASAAIDDALLDFPTTEALANDLVKDSSSIVLEKSNPGDIPDAEFFLVDVDEEVFLEGPDTDALTEAPPVVSEFLLDPAILDLASAPSMFASSSGFICCEMVAE